MDANATSALWETCLEAGDAIVRAGLRTSGAARIAWFVAGAMVLFSYGYTVNTPKWDFGRVLGVYVTIFFLVAQLIGWIFFHESPSRAIIAGGALILAGGTVITYWK
jgi:drug/metabolite transporter (DMT)-like permease